MIVNEREAMSRLNYWKLKRRAPPGVPVYQQTPFQNDVWEALDGDKDDFLVYDRCGLLTFHVVLPYSMLDYPYVEAAIRATYFKNICNCTADSNHTTSGSSSVKNETSQFNQTASTTFTDQDNPEKGDRSPDTHDHSHHHSHHHPHHHPHTPPQPLPPEQVHNGTSHNQSTHHHQS